MCIYVRLIYILLVDRVCTCLSLFNMVKYDTLNANHNSAGAV